MSIFSEFDYLFNFFYHLRPAVCDTRFIFGKTIFTGIFFLAAFFWGRGLGKGLGLGVGERVGCDPLYSINSQCGIRVSWNSTYLSFLGSEAVGGMQDMVVRRDTLCPSDG